MQTSINTLSEVELEIDITLTADEMLPDVKKALRRQQVRTQMRGFRPGKVPLNLVKRMYGRDLAPIIAEEKVKDVYKEEVQEGDKFDVVGQSTITTLEYELDGDLHAVIRFSVKPKIDLVDVTEEEIYRVVHDVTDDEVEQEIENILRKRADLVPVEDEGAGPEDLVVVDLQRLDEDTGLPIIGEREEDTEIFLDDERVHDELRESLLGAPAGEVVVAGIPHQHGDHVHVHTYEVTVREVKRRDVPELDDEFVDEITKGELEDVAAFREYVRDGMEGAWERQGREVLEQQVRERMLALHTVPVPPAFVEAYLDAFVADVKSRNDGELPDDVDETHFREENRRVAEEQARWTLLRDAVVEAYGLEVAEDEINAYFAEHTSDGIDPQVLRQYYQSSNMMDRVTQDLLDTKLMDALIERFTVVDKDEEAFEDAVRARRNATLAAEAAPGDAAEETVSDAS